MVYTISNVWVALARRVNKSFGLRFCLCICHKSIRCERALELESSLGRSPVLGVKLVM